ncbi:hypothetical protein ACTXT7_002569 [Hymenolepis weldensis]
MVGQLKLCMVVLHPEAFLAWDKLNYRYVFKNRARITNRDCGVHKLTRLMESRALEQAGKCGM